jgi:glycerophosphoryl diester phosphodiesterase
LNILLRDKYWNYNQFIVSSFDWNALQQVAFQCTVGVLTEENLDLALAYEFIQANQFILITIC